MATEEELKKIWNETEELMKSDGGSDEKSFRK